MTLSASMHTEVAKVFHFEFWLRYYFIEERDNELFIAITDEQMEHMRKQFPDFVELAERMMGVALTPELSQMRVVEFLQLHYEGSRFPPNSIPKILDSKDFSVEMYLFDTWLNLHENQLMQKIYGFDQWMHFLDEWKQSDKAQQLMHSLKVQIQEETGAIN